MMPVNRMPAMTSVVITGRRMNISGTVIVGWEHRTLNAEHRTLNRRNPSVFDVRCWMFDVFSWCPFGFPAVVILDVYFRSGRKPQLPVSDDGLAGFNSFFD